MLLFGVFSVQQLKNFTSYFAIRESWVAAVPWFRSNDHKCVSLSDSCLVSEAYFLEVSMQAAVEKGDGGSKKSRGFQRIFYRGRVTNGTPRWWDRWNWPCPYVARSVLSVNLAKIAVRAMSVTFSVFLVLTLFFLAPPFFLGECRLLDVCFENYILLYRTVQLRQRVTSRLLYHDLRINRHLIMIITVWRSIVTTAELGLIRKWGQSCGLTLN